MTTAAVPDRARELAGDVVEVLGSHALLREGGDAVKDALDVAAEQLGPFVGELEQWRRFEHPNQVQHEEELHRLPLELPIGGSMWTFTYDPGDPNAGVAPCHGCDELDEVVERALAGLGQRQEYIQALVTLEALRDTAESKGLQTALNRVLAKLSTHYTAAFGDDPPVRVMG